MAQFRLNQISNDQGVSQFTISNGAFGPISYFQQIPAEYEGQTVTSADYYFYIISLPNKYTAELYRVKGERGRIMWGEYEAGQTGWQRTWLLSGISISLFDGITYGASLRAPGGGVVGSLTAYTEKSSYVPYFQITTAPKEFSIVNQYPVAGSNITRTKVSRFGWTITNAADLLLIGTVKQKAATFQWRVQGSESVNYITAAVSGTTGYVDIPANTFTADNIEWRMVVDSNGGYTAVSDWILINTADVLSSAVAVYPNAVVVEDISGVQFRWTHVISTGTAQTGFQIQYSINQGGSWVTLTAQNGAENNYRAAHNAIPSGAMLWQVRTKNSTGTYGSWSPAVGAVIRVAPDTPSIMYIDTKPRITVQWQGTGQQAYRVLVRQGNVVTYDGGMTYGTDKSLRLPTYLPNGVYVVQVQIQNDAGLTSAFATVETTVINNSRGLFDVHTNSDHASVSLSWEMVKLAVRYYVLRDEMPIAMVADGEDMSYTDYLCCGVHEYKVMAIDNDDYYTMSREVNEKALPLYALLVPVEKPEEWMLLKWNQDTSDNYSRSGGYAKEYITYQGREKPVPYVSQTRSMNNAIKYMLKNREDCASLESLDGQVVAFKNRHGDRLIGTIDAYSARNGRKSEVSFEIIETDYNEAVPYV